MLVDNEFTGLAASGRTDCRACGEVIRRGTWRTVMELIAFDFGRLRKASVHYHPCCYRPQREVWVSLWPRRAPSDGEEARQMFVQACRLAAQSQIEEFRSSVFSSGTATCPLSGETLTRDIAHVHHGFPFSFKAIIQSFLEARGHDVKNMTYCLRRFSDHALANDFADYHRRHANLTVVHRSANQSQLNKEENADMGSCFRCSRFLHLDWVPELRLALCRGCKYDMFLSATEAKTIFGIQDLSALWHMKRPNPVRAHFAPMKLYLADDVHAIVLARDGSAEATIRKQASIDRRLADSLRARVQYCLRLRSGGAPSEKNNQSKRDMPLPKAVIRRQKKQPRRTFLLTALESAAAVAANTSPISPSQGLP